MSLIVTFHPWRDTPRALAPERPLFALSDIHGYSGAFRSVIRHLERISAGHEVALLGDLTSRGPDSLGCVREALRIRDNPAFSGCVMIRGNHCVALRGALEGDAWAANIMGRGAWAQIRSASTDRAARADIISYLSGLRDYAVRGGLLLTHAVPDPGIRADRQPWDSLIWKRDFVDAAVGWRRVAGRDALLVHGHTARGGPEIMDDDLTRREAVCVDLGTCRSRRIGVAEFDPAGRVRLIEFGMAERPE